MNGASGNIAFIRANTNKKKREKSALAEVIGKKDSAANEAIVEAIEEATFGELRACFPLVFDGRLSSSNNKEWLKAIMKRKLVTDKTYKFVPRTRYSSKNRLSKKKIQKTTKEIEKEEETITKSENIPLKESGNGTTIPPSPSAIIIEEEDDDEEPNTKKEVVFSVEVARREEHDEENGRVHEAIVTNAKTSVSEVEPKDEDVVTTLFVANTHTQLLFFSTDGMAYKLKTWRLPLGARTAKGKAIVNILPIQTGVSIAAVMPVDAPEEEWEKLQIIFSTSSGDVRRNALSDFTNVRSNGKIAMDLPEDITLVNARIANEDDDVMLVTDSGRAIRFSTTAVRVFKGRKSTGVRGIKLLGDDKVVSMSIIRHFEASPDERSAYLKMRRAVAGMSDDAVGSPEEEDEEKKFVHVLSARVKGVCRIFCLL